jgi:hypothetical protein
VKRFAIIGLLVMGESFSARAATAYDTVCGGGSSYDVIAETEPNNTLATANPLSTHVGFCAAINYAGDVDYFSFHVPGPATVLDTIYSTTNLDFTLFNPSGSAIASADDTTAFTDSNPLAGGTYGLRIEAVDPSSVIAGYAWAFEQLPTDVPEPSAALGIMAALLAFFAIKWRRATTLRPTAIGSARVRLRGPGWSARS